jgi:hypothetical protein
MTLLRPTGEYVSQITTPPKAWPSADEDAHSHRAAELLKTAPQLEKAWASWLHTRSSISMAIHNWDGIRRSQDLPKRIARWVIESVERQSLCHNASSGIKPSSQPDTSQPNYRSRRHKYPKPRGTQATRHR